MMPNIHLRQEVMLLVEGESLLFQVADVRVCKCYGEIVHAAMDCCQG